uniref:peptidylprolyl isomerase n=1 Tax=Chaetoceros debilis TaxID=122233 RepID=A0A7S3QJ19_9STRA|mmetsp:Transcript_29509/g.45042  ORF Transcript_29509/g.45042 Transcript_29509/m.45042 type:complete len:298 (+) Transcript_29509:89-982(+)
MKPQFLVAIFLLALANHEAFTIRHLSKRSLPATTHTLLMSPIEGRREEDVDNSNNKCKLCIDTDDGDTVINTKEICSSRRLISSRIFATFTFTGVGSLLSLPRAALAGIDVSSLKSLPVDGDASGAATRLKNLQMQGTKIERGVDVGVMTTLKRLESGVTYRDINYGRDGSRTVRRGSNVGAEMTVRCKSLATPSEPEGAKYYSTKVDNGANEISWTLGSGDFPRGLEEGMMGMKLNAVRRIEVPSQQIFAARNASQLPEATTEEGRRLYAGAFQSGDATLVFEVYVTGINQGDNRI